MPTLPDGNLVKHDAFRAPGLGKSGAEIWGELLKGESLTVSELTTPYRAPRANAVCERFLGSVRRESLDQMLIWNEGQLYRVTKENVAFFSRTRPHQSIDQRMTEKMGASVEEKREGKIVAFPVLNGLHPDYRRAA